jgi:hypothetical protein
MFELPFLYLQCKDTKVRSPQPHPTPIAPATTATGQPQPLGITSDPTKSSYHMVRALSQKK